MFSTSCWYSAKSAGAKFPNKNSETFSSLLFSLIVYIQLWLSYMANWDDLSKRSHERPLATPSQPIKSTPKKRNGIDREWIFWTNIHNFRREKHRNLQERRNFHHRDILLDANISPRNSQGREILDKFLHRKLNFPLKSSRSILEARKLQNIRLHL